MDWNSVIWNMLASGLTVDEIKEGFALFDVDDIDTVKREFDEEMD